MYNLLQKVICKDVVQKIIYEYTDRVPSKKVVKNAYERVLTQLKYRIVLIELSRLFRRILIFR